MRHDPERDAAAYLAGELSTLRRLRFERHMLDCRACWTEATTARQGRMLAESLRQVAPPSTRERIRAVADLGEPETSRRQWPYLLATATAVLAVLAALVIPRVVEHGPPPPLAAAAELLHAGDLRLAASPAPPAEQIGSYGWRGTARQEVGGIPATVYSYADPAGRTILVLTAKQDFPRADQARDLDPGPSWIATVKGVSLLCADTEELSWLAVAPDDATALTAGRALGLSR
jgi:hypothetical protein